MSVKNKKKVEPLKPSVQAAQDKLMALATSGFKHRMDVEQNDMAGTSQPPATAVVPVQVSPPITPRPAAPAATPVPAVPAIMPSITQRPEMPSPTQPQAFPAVSAANTLLPLVQPRSEPKPLPKKQDPDYMATSTYLLRSLNQRGKIVAAQLGVDFADLINMALYSYLIDFEEGLAGTNPVITNDQ